MNLYRYSAQCDALASELIDSLSAQDRAALYELLDGHDRETWMAWREEHAALVRAYVSATPAQRARKKAFREHRLLLPLAAIQHCLEAQALLRAIDGLEPGHSYRSMASMAGHAYQNLIDSHIPEWPFDDDPPSPFA